jgi:hypothetical protein
MWSKINNKLIMAYSKEEIEITFTTICERIEEGESLRSVLRDSDMPSSRTFFKWLDKDDSKVKQYARATVMRADAMFDEMIEISDTPQDGIETTTKANGDVDIKKGDMLGHRRLQIDTRKWSLSKMNPKKYGDKVENVNRNVNYNAEVSKEEAKIIDEALENDY